MADINHTISLGIGSPAAIGEFLTFGLITLEPPVDYASAEWTASNTPMHFTPNPRKAEWTNRRKPMHWTAKKT